LAKNFATLSDLAKINDRRLSTLLGRPIRPKAAAQYATKRSPIEQHRHVGGIGGAAGVDASAIAIGVPALKFLSRCSEKFA